MLSHKVQFGQALTTVIVVGFIVTAGSSDLLACGGGGGFGGRSLAGRFVRQRRQAAFAAPRQNSYAATNQAVVAPVAQTFAARYGQPSPAATSSLIPTTAAAFPLLTQTPANALFQPDPALVTSQVAEKADDRGAAVANRQAAQPVDRQPESQPAAAAGESRPEPAAVQLPNLEIVSIQLLNAASEGEAGPVYRVCVRNAGTVAVGNPCTLTAVAENPGDRGSVRPQATATVGALAANQSATVDLKFDRPLAEAAFPKLVVAIDSQSQIDESAESDNLAIVARQEIPLVAPSITSVQSVASARPELRLQGEGFGDAAGQVLLDVGDVRLSLEASQWNSGTVAVTLPAVQAKAGADTRLIVVRSDGAASQPYDLSAMQMRLTRN